MRSYVAVLAAALVATVVPCAPAQAALLAQTSDETQDVKVLPGPGPSGRDRRSIDLRSFKVTSGQLVEPSVRVTFRIKRITEPGSFVQDLRLRLTDADPASPRVSGEVIVLVQALRETVTSASVETEDEGSGTSCGGLLPRVDRRTATVKLDIPLECLPPGLVRMRVATSTRDSDGNTVYSRDHDRVAGSLDLGGTAGSD